MLAARLRLTGCSRSVLAASWCLHWLLTSCAACCCILVASQALLKRANGTLQWQPGGSRKLLLGRELHHHLQPCVANMAFHE